MSDSPFKYAASTSRCSLDRMIGPAFCPEIRSYFLQIFLMAVTFRVLPRAGGRRVSEQRARQRQGRT
jgi:hypothetical protein